MKPITSQLVVLNLGKGSLNQGFSQIVAQLWEAGSPHPIQLTASLPSNVELIQLDEQWRALYNALSSKLHWRRSQPDDIEIEEDNLTNISTTEFQKLCEQVKFCLNMWLDSLDFSKMERRLRAKLTQDHTLRVIVESEDEATRQLPWHQWSFFEDYPLAEVALGVEDFTRVRPTKRTPNGRVRILAVLGCSTGIDIQQDRVILENLPESDTFFLVEPTRSELDRWLWDDLGWDILFFAGHSSSQDLGQHGYLEINPSEHLSIPHLRNAMKGAISRGLQLAIFNSCDGLGLAKELANLALPQLVVMREPVPDLVAQEFLKKLLLTFHKGQSLYESVREAREKLQGLEDTYPCASWLPIICQNPSASPPTWQRLRLGLLPEESMSRWHGLRIVSFACLALTGFVVGLRQLGYLESYELTAYDRLMQLRPAEEPDDRLLIITVTAADIQSVTAQERENSSLANSSLEQLLMRLESAKPQVIGLDIYRDFPIDPKHQDLIAQFQKNDRFISICKLWESEEDPGTPPSKEIPTPDLRSRVGFSDGIRDVDGVFRRYLFGMAPPPQSSCQVDIAFGMQVALRYFKDKYVSGMTEADELQIGEVIFKSLESNSGSYQNIDVSSFQLLLNYRAGDQIATTMTLQEALEDERLSELAQDRVVLIGTVAPSFGDLHLTPYSDNAFEEMPGILIQAHGISQILSAVEDGRSLMWWWPDWIETIWISCWALGGGLLVLTVKSLYRSGAIILILAGSINLGCYLLFLPGGWIPLVPPLLTLVGGAGIGAIYRRYQWTVSRKMAS